MPNERALRIPGELARVLVAYREQMRIPTRPVVSGRVLDYVERATGLYLPDDLVAVFAATGFDLQQIARLTAEACDEHDVPENQLVVAEGDDARCRWRAQVRVAKGRVPRLARTEIFYCSKFGKRLGDSLSVAEFARKYLKVQPTDFEIAPLGFEAAMATFRPGVLRERTTPRRHVRHRKLGQAGVRFGQERAPSVASFSGTVDVQKVAS